MKNRFIPAAFSVFVLLSVAGVLLIGWDAEAAGAIQVGASADDAYHDPDSWPGYSSTDPGNGVVSGNPGGAGQATWGGWRWAVAIPSGATVTEAYVELTQRGWGATFTTLLTLERDPAAPGFAATSTPYHRWSNKTAFQASWSWPRSVPGAAIKTPSLAAGVQELVNTFGGISSLVLIENGAGVQPSLYHSWESFESNPAAAARLYVSFTTGAGSQAPTATATPTRTPTPVPAATATPTRTPTPPPAGTLPLLGRWNDPAGAKDLGVAGEGNYAYLGHHQNAQGVDIIDISNPASPVRVGILGAGSIPAGDIEVRNGILYIATYLNGFGTYIADVSNPASPKVLARITTPSLSHNLHLDWPYLYIADNVTPAKVHAFNVSSPASPVLVRTINVPGHQVHDISTRNGRLFVSTWTTLVIVDVSNLTGGAPVLGTLTVPNSANWPSGDGRYLYLTYEALNCARGESGPLTVVDVSSPASPRIVKTLHPAALGFGQNGSYFPYVRGNRLYVTWQGAGLKRFDITDPANPVLDGQFDTTLGTGGNCVADGAVGLVPGASGILVSDWDNGLFVLSAP